MPFLRVVPLPFITRRAMMALLLTVCLGVGSPRAATYALDQQDAQIDFTVRNFSMFSSHGAFQRFKTSMNLDSRHPERTMISVDVDATSVDMPWRDGVDMLRSPDFFDVKRFPLIHFASTEVKPDGNDHFMVLGQIQIRSVSQPLVLEVRLLGRHPDPGVGGDVADFVATGTLQRSDFGMTADKLMISDKVDITIHARIALQAATRAD